jgi:CMP-N,N'-diacetyllegionaminic acid synthase
MTDSKYLAIVTARAGSKRLPNKNVRELCGLPLFLWSVRAGLECPQIAETIVSTDSEDYRALAQNAGASCPCLRNAMLASDTASSADVVLDVLDHCTERETQYRGLVLLQPTSPLRTAADISAAIRLYETSGAPAVVSVCDAECPPAWLGQLNGDLRMDDFIRPEFRGKRSQDLGSWYRINGAIYVIGIDVFRANHGFLPKDTRAYIMPRERSVDIDNAIDFDLANMLMTRHLQAK